ncbi:MAG: hypothetical protein IRZ13_20555 [Acetobacteraceae bacterium]|nr:hypothetical protein [Acetobacteraceae bacterium]
MSGSEIWNWLKENSLLLAAGLAVLGVIIVAIGLPHIAAFVFMAVGLCLMLRTERDRNRGVP